MATKNSHEIEIYNMTDDMEMNVVQHALYEAGVGDAGDDENGMYLRGKSRSVFVEPTDVGIAVKVLNALGYETDEDLPTDSTMNLNADDVHAASAQPVSDGFNTHLCDNCGNHMRDGIAICDSCYDFLEMKGHLPNAEERLTGHAATQTPAANENAVSDAPEKCEHGILVPYCAECYEEGGIGKTYRANQLMKQHEERQSRNRRAETVDTKDATIAALRAAIDSVLEMQPLTLSQVINENYGIGYNLALVKIKVRLALAKGE